MASQVLHGRYELRRLIGSGGMAQVWEARDGVLERLVAVKTVDLAGADDPTLGERLQREAVATATLAHPDIVTVYDAGVEGSTAFLVMELLSGRNLAAVLRDGPLPVDEAVRIGERVSGALAAAHRAGIVHRDIKPGNVLVDGGQVTVVDFGIAAVTRAAQASLTVPGTVLGTAQFIAPEQADGGSASPASDMYAFGCFLTALLTGSGPFTGEDPVEVLRQHVTAAPRRLRDVRPEVPEDLDGLIGRLLAKAPAARPTAEQAEDLLRDVASSTGSAAAAAGVAGGTKVLPLDEAAGAPPKLPPSFPVGGSAPVGGAATVPRRIPVQATDPAPRRRRPARLLMVAGGLVLVLAVAAIALVTNPPPPADAEPPAASDEVPAGPEAVAPEPPAQDQATEVPQAPPGSVPFEEVPALLASLDVENRVRNDLAKRWEEITDALDEEDEDAAVDTSGEMVRKVDELVAEGKLGPEEGQTVRSTLVALFGEPAADEDRRNGQGDADDDD